MANNLAFQENLEIDRAVGCPRCKRCDVDAVNGMDKKSIHCEAMKASNNKNLDGMSKVDTPNLQTVTVNNVRGKLQCSAAMNCRHIHKKKGQKGVKS